MQAIDRIALIERTDEIITVLVESVNQALFIVEPESPRFLGVNEKAAALLGYSKRELMALDADRVFSLDILVLWQSMSAWKKPLIKTSKLLTKAEKPLYRNLKNYAVEYEGRVVILAIVSDPNQSGETESDTLVCETTDREDAAEFIETMVNFPSIIGQSNQIREVCSQIGLVAKTGTSVLVQGETGTGKELVAQAIHFHSNRTHGPLIKVNCAALTETLLESELFGHKKGSFTGAVQDRKGRFKLADGGTLILDEIGCMSLSGQAKLLRVLQEKEFEPIGESRSVKVDVRVVAITNADLVEEVDKGKFREDLFYRLNVFPIQLPPLRERNEDIPLLAQHFLNGYTASLKKQIRDIELDAISRLMSYPWPGNIRELENTIEYGVILEKGKTLRVCSLPDKLKRTRTHICLLKDRLNAAERQCIQEALNQANGVKKRAAQLLGIDRRNLSYFLNKHGIH